MECEKALDEALQSDKLDVLYGEADTAVRARVSAHLAACAACREELGALASVRRDLARWRLPLARPGFTPRGLLVPNWLAAAALVLLSFSATLGVTGYLALRRDVAAQEARAALVEQRQREAHAAFEARLAAVAAAPASADGLLARVDARVDERLSSSAEQQRARLERRLAQLEERAEVQRRVDRAEVAASLSYLDGRHGEQLARTNELMGYMLQASEKR